METRNAERKTRNKKMNKLLLSCILTAFAATTFAADKTTAAVDTFQFTIVKENKITPVKKSGKFGNLLELFGAWIFRV